MAVSTSLKADLEEKLAPLGPVTIRSMFGGAGIFLDGTMFALIARDTVYFKVDETNRPAFEAEGLMPFIYATRRGEHTITSYWRAPDRLMDDSEEFVAWARDAVRAAARKAAAKKTPSMREMPPTQHSRPARTPRARSPKATEK